MSDFCVCVLILLADKKTSANIHAFCMSELSLADSLTDKVTPREASISKNGALQTNVCSSGAAIARKVLATGTTVNSNIKI